MYRHGLLKFLPGDPSSPLDLVPVDYVIDAVYELSARNGGTGECYHLTAGRDNGTTLGEIRDLAARHFKREPFTIVPPAQFEALIAKMAGRLSERELEAVEEIRLYMPYLTGGLLFDDAHTRRDTGLAAPPVRSYFKTMAAYIIEHD
jgi:hypothetical protein